MGVINGAKYVGRDQIRIPGGDIITIRQAEKVGFWTEEERAIHKSGRPKGVKNFSGRPLNAKDIKYLFNGIDKATKRAIAEGGYRGMFALGKELLSTVTRQRKFNSYTGNLMDAYQATIVTQGLPIKKIFYEANKNKVLRTKNGKRYAMLQEPAKHTRFGKIRENRKGEKWGKKINRKRRYLKSYELNNGYRKYGMNTPMNGIVSGVVIENTAPYAEMVNRRYRVLQQSSAINGMIRWKRQFSKLILVATRKEFKAAGLVK